MTVLMQKFLSLLGHLFVCVLRLGFVLVGTIDVRLQLGQQGFEDQLKIDVPLVRFVENMASYAVLWFSFFTWSEMGSHQCVVSLIVSESCGSSAAALNHRHLHWQHRNLVDKLLVGGLDLGIAGEALCCKISVVVSFHLGMKLLQLSNAAQWNEAVVHQLKDAVTTCPAVHPSLTK